MGMLSSGSSWLQSKRRTSMTIAGTYTKRDGTVFTDVPMTPAESSFKLTEEFKTTVNVRAQDYKIDVIDIENHVPEPGDMITVTGFLQEVLPLEDRKGKKPCWAWADVNKTVYRIHTKNVGKQ